MAFNDTTDVLICTTPGCVLAASELLRSMSPNYKDIDPCDDFRAYVCEGFDATHDLRSDQVSRLRIQDGWQE